MCIEHAICLLTYGSLCVLLVTSEVDFTYLFRDRPHVKCTFLLLLTFLQGYGFFLLFALTNTFEPHHEKTCLRVIVRHKLVRTTTKDG